MHDEELYHFGIKGQKWGVRRFQNKDGSLTPAGKKRYDDDGSGASKEKSKMENTPKKKSGHRLYLEKAYREKGMSKEEAVAAAEKRIKVEKALAITAGVTLAGCAAYYAKNKWVADHCDQVLKKGTTFHNLHNEASERPGEHLYVNYRQNDKNYFRGHFSLGKLKRTGHVYDHTIQAKEDVKIPSLKTRKETFKQLFDNDPDFRETFRRHSNTLVDGDSNTVYRRMWQKMGDKDDPKFNEAKRKYYDALQKKGYTAIVDEWGTNPRVFRSDAPLILLNTSHKSLGEMKIKELTAKEILISQANSRHYESGRTALTTFSLPHANNFKESTKHLERYAKRNAKNTKYIDKALSEMGNMTTEQMNNLALGKKGAILSDAGRYMSVNKKLKAETAMKIAKGKEAVADTAYLAGLTIVPYTAVVRGAENVAVENYVKKHPKTKLSNAEIRRRYRNGQL